MNSLEKQVLKIVAENTTSPDVFTDDATGLAQIRDSLGIAIQQICMATGGYKKRYFLPLREECQFYRMDWETDFFGYVINAWDRSRHRRLDQIDLMALSALDPFWMQNNGPPEKYIQIGYQYIGVYLKPADSSRILELDCVVIPKLYTADTDPVKIREAFERGAIQQAASEYFASRGDAARAIEWINRGLETVGLKRLNPEQNERQFQFGGFNRYPSNSRHNGNI